MTRGDGGGPRHGILALAVLAALAAAPGHGQAGVTAPQPAGPPEAERPAPPTPAEPADQGADGLADDDEAPPPPAEPTTANPCDVGSAQEVPILDKMRQGVFESVCNTARWFDGFFGDRRFDDEALETSGRAGLSVLWDEFEGFDAKARLRVRVDLPNVDERVNAFFGRDDEDFFSGQGEGFDVQPDIFRSVEDEEWLLGLGYNPVGDARHRLDFDAGVKVRFPLEPFVRGRYRHFWPLGSRHVLRLTETVYWRNQKGVGTTTAVGFERAFSTQLLGRWEGRGTFDQSTEGLDWHSGFTLYQGLTPTSALAWYAGAEGASDADVPLRSYGVNVRYRRQMLREWFFGQVQGGVSWPREELDEERDIAWHLGFGFEISFSGRELWESGRHRPEPALPSAP